MISSPSVVVTSPTGYNPAQLPSLHSTCIIKYSRDNNKLYKDIGKTTLALVQNDPIAVITCPVTGYDYVARTSNFPLLKTDGAGRWWAEIDGSNMTMEGPVIAASPYSIYVKYKKNLANAGRVLANIATFNWLFGTWNTRSTEMFDGTFRSSNVNDSDLSDWQGTLIRSNTGGQIYFNGVNLTDTSVTGIHPTTALSLFGWGVVELYTGRFYGMMISLIDNTDPDRIAAQNYLSGF